MRLTLRQFYVGSVVAGALGFPLVVALAWTDPPSSRPVYDPSRIWLAGPFQKASVEGNAFIAIVPQFDSLADAENHPSRSPLVLYENEKPMGPAHSVHSAIALKGAGRYSHWQGVGVIFSASDNTDPNWNWKRYSLRIAQSPP